MRKKRHDEKKGRKESSKATPNIKKYMEMNKLRQKIHQTPSDQWKDLIVAFFGPIFDLAK